MTDHRQGKEQQTEGGATSDCSEDAGQTGPVVPNDTSVGRAEAVPPIGLRERLVGTAPRERAGPRSANRIEYQRHWALVELLARHQRGEEYCLLLEHHDDVVFLDRDDSPNRIEFFQVKTHDRDWTITALVARHLPAPRSEPIKRPHPSEEGPGEPQLSIVGKLYDNWLKFQQETHALTLVSNRAISRTCKLRPPAERRAFCATALPDRDWGKLVEAIRAEHGGGTPTDGLRLMHVVQSEIPVVGAGATAYSLGALTLFLEARFPGRRAPAVALHGAVMSELARLGTFEGVTHRSFEALLEAQGLSRSQFEAMVVRAGQTEDVEAAWQNVRAQLEREQQWPFMRLQRLHECWRDYLVDRMDGANISLQQQRSRVRREIIPWQNEEYCGSLTDVIAGVRAACETAGDALPKPGQSDLYVAAMILLELVTREPASDTIQTTSPRTPQEAA